MSGKILRPRVFSVLARICRARRISLRWNCANHDDREVEGIVSMLPDFVRYMKIRSM